MAAMKKVLIRYIGALNWNMMANSAFTVEKYPTIQLKLIKTMTKPNSHYKYKWDYVEKQSSKYKCPK